MGSDDERLDPRYLAELADGVRAAGGTVDPWQVQGSGHTEALTLVPGEYERRLVEFFESALGGIPLRGWSVGLTAVNDRETGGRSREPRAHEDPHSQPISPEMEMAQSGGGAAWSLIASGRSRNVRRPPLASSRS